MFLAKDELRTVAQLPIIDKITAEDDSIIDIIIDESIAVMSSMLSRYYDVDVIFAKEGNERNKTIVKYLKDICIYEIYNRCTREQNEVAENRYNIAMEWLTKLNTGELEDSTLPLRQVVEDGNATTGDVRYGGNKRYNSIY
jgi:phage gp36-like protein